MSPGVEYKEASCQTDYPTATACSNLVTAQQPLLCLVTGKAFPRGMRVEHIPLLPPTLSTGDPTTNASDLTTGIYRWDVSRSARRHQVRGRRNERKPCINAY